MKNKISAAFFTVVMAATMLAAVSVSGCGEVEPPPVVTPPYVPDAPAVTDPGDEEGSLHAADGYDYYVHWVKSGDNYI